MSIPILGLELKNQLTGQSIKNGIHQWQNDRDHREPAFKFNHRLLVFMAMDLYECAMTTRLEGKKTFFLPFNQGSNGAGNDGGAGNPPVEGDYVTSYIWRNVLQKDSFLDILQKFIHPQREKEAARQANGTVKEASVKKIIFPRYHQLDVVRRLIADVKAVGSGKNYLIQFSVWIIMPAVSRYECFSAQGDLERVQVFGELTSIYRMEPIDSRYAKNFLEKFSDIALLADLMGHESIETTRIYLRRTASEQRAIVDKVVTW